MTNKDVNDVNIKLNSQLDDDDIHATKKSNTTAEINKKINENFAHGAEDNGLAVPTYIYNNTPAIKINNKKK